MRPATIEYDETDISSRAQMGDITGELTPVSPLRRRNGRFGDFEIVAPLARGGTGGVYLAVNAITGKHVALKVLDPKFAHYADLADRLYAEAELAARTRHPNVLEIHGAAWSDSDGTPYLVMEYLDGESLATICDRDDQIELGFAIGAGAQVAAALSALHAVGVIHCDVKLDNVIVLDRKSSNGLPVVKVVDFGVSRLVDDPPLDTIAGTPASMAPEQWRCAPEYASDVYALGCVMYELVTGAPLFDGSLPEIMMAHLEQRPSRPSWLRAMPVDLERLILRALAKEPADRPTMAEMADELARLADAHTVRGSDSAIDLARLAG